MSGHEEELERLRAAVTCATVLDRLAPGWTLDVRESTRRCLKYRGGSGEIVMVTHDGWPGTFVSTSPRSLASG